MLDLPLEIIAKILSNLHYTDLFALECSSKAMKNLVEKIVWQSNLSLKWGLCILCPDRNYHSEKWQPFITAKLDMLLKKCSNSLHTLSLSFNYKSETLLVDETLYKCIHRLKNLKELDISGLDLRKRWQTSDVKAEDLFNAIANACGSTLESFNCGHYPFVQTKISKQCYHNFLASCQRLKHLKISYTGRLTDSDANTFELMPDRMQTICMSYVRIPSVALRQIADKSGETLTKLEFSTDSFTQTQDVKYLFAKLIRLKHLLIVDESRCPNFQLFMTSLPFTSSLRNTLESLVINAPRVVNLSAQIMNSSFPNLRTFEYLARHEDFVLKEILMQKRFQIDFSNLVHLAIHDTNALTDDALKIIAQMGRLEAVKVIYCARVTVLGMSYFLEYCKKLSHMEVGHQLAENGLLDMVHETLNQRMPQGVRPTSMHDSRLFYFVLIQEFNPMRTGENKVWRSRNNYPIPWKKTYDNENMHPWVLLQKPYWHSFCFSLHQIYHY